MFHTLAPLVAILFWSGNIFAADNTASPECESPRIASLASTLIEERESFSLLQRRHLTEDALYLLIKHGGLSDTEIDRRLDEAVAMDLPNSEEVRLVYRLETGQAHPEEIDALAFQPSVWRALIHADNGKRFFELARVARMDKFRTFGFDREGIVAYYVVLLLFDAPEEVRAKVAATAEQMDEVRSALALLADQPNLDAYHEMARRLGDHDALFSKDYIRRRFPLTVGAAILRQPGQTVPVPKDASDELRIVREADFQIIRADYRLGHFGFLRPFLNQTGKVKEIGAVAQELNEMLDEKPSLSRRPRNMRMHLNGELINRLGREEVDEALAFGSSERPHMKNRSVANNIHRDIAAGALADFVTSAVPDHPSRSPLLPAGFDWASWIATAERLRHRKPVDAGQADVALDLALAAHRTGDAIGVIDTYFSGFDRFLRLKHVMNRLDRRCPSYVMERGNGFARFTMPIYRFD